MIEVISQLIRKYQCKSKADYENALQEVMQEIALEGMSRAGFFEKGAFYGGTCLRILYKLDRFSEDLDFSLLEPDPQFDLIPYLRAIETHFASYGLDVTVLKKEKTQESAIKSGFLKANTLETFIRIGLTEEERKRCHVEENIKIKIEIDIDPPPGFDTEIIEMLTPGLFFVKSYVQADLFSGKMSAVLGRSWKSRTKGRDWYDLIWFISREIPLHLSHLEKRMHQTGHLPPSESLTPEKFKELYQKRVDSLDVESARDDILRFIRDPRRIELWSRQFFLNILPKITFC